MKIWGLIADVDGDEEERREYLNNIIRPICEECDVITLDSSLLDLSVEGELKVFYAGKEMELPDAFWPMISNTDELLVEKMLLNAGVKSVINLDDFQVARSKAATCQRLAMHGIRVPKTTLFFTSKERRKVVEKLGYPFVAKPDNGFGGEHVALIHSEEEFEAYLAQLKLGNTYLAQEYIATSRGCDIRVVMLDGNCIYSAMRSATDPKEFRSNVHVGGEIKEYPITDEAKELCRTIAGCFDLPLLGIDLLVGDGEYIVAEVNAFPGIGRVMLADAVKVIMERFRG